MKKILALFILFFVTYCQDFFNTEVNEITYAFVNGQNVSDLDKKKTIQVLNNRLSKYTSQVDVFLNLNNEVVVRLPSNIDMKRVNTIVENEGKLDFWLCFRRDELFSLFAQKVDSEEEIDFSSYFKNYQPYGGLFNLSVKDTTKLNTFLTKVKQKDLLTDELKNVEFLYSLPENNEVVVYAVDYSITGKSKVNESHIIEARQDFDAINRPTVSLKMNEEGAVKWAEITGTAFDGQRQIAITLNENVYSAPGVSSGPITGGVSQISGDFNLEETKKLVAILGGQARIPKLKFVKIKKIEH